MLKFRVDRYIYKSVLSVFIHKNLALSCGFMCDRKTNPKKIGQCRYFWVFRTDQKKIRSGAVCLVNFVIESAYVPSTNFRKKSNERTSD